VHGGAAAGGEESERRHAPPPSAPRLTHSGGVVAAPARGLQARHSGRTSASKYAADEALLAASQEAHAANLDTYRNGLSTIVELLTTDRDLANARFAMIQSTADLLTASAPVTYAIGAVEPPKRP
jgi:hypothetical protein